jgi:hypothetical protein
LFFSFVSLAVTQTAYSDTTPQTTARSTSSPAMIAYKDDKGNVQQTSDGSPLENGNCYATIGVPSVRVFAQTSWLKAIFDTASLAFASTKLSGKSSGKIDVADTRVGTPRPIKKGDTIVDMGFGVYFLDAVPWDFASLHLDLAINSSADSTITKIADGVSSVSKDIPGFQLSAAVNGGISIAEVFDKLLFGQSRSEARLYGGFDLVTQGKSTMRTGCYVVFGADSATDYDKYLVPDAKGHSQLVWDSSQLLFNAKPVNDVSYFIITVESQPTLFPNTDSAPLNSGRDWATPLQNAQLSIVTLPLSADDTTRNTAMAAIKADIVKGQTLLLADPDILISEKKAILKGVSDSFTAALSTATAQALAAAHNPSATPAPKPASTAMRGPKLFASSYNQTTPPPVVNITPQQKYISEHAVKSKDEVNNILQAFANPSGM